MLFLVCVFFVWLLFLRNFLSSFFTDVLCFATKKKSLDSALFVVSVLLRFFLLNKKEEEEEQSAFESV